VGTQTRAPDTVLTHLGSWSGAVADALATGAEWLWLVDGDVVPEPDALAELLAAVATAERAGLPAPALVASRVLDAAGAVDRRCAPWFPLLDRAVVIAAAVEHLASLRLARWGSLLVHRGAVERHGPPRAAFAAGADDLEWTVRVLRDEAGYLAPRSVARVGAAGRPPIAGAREALGRARMLRSPGWVAQEPVWFAFMLLSELASGRRAARAPR
jgi:hypothetical protein